MKALRIHDFGATSQVVLEDEPPAAPGAGHVGVRIEAASVNPLDLKILAGYMQPIFPVQFPYTLGTDFAGTVEAIGAEVSGVKLGDRVVGRLAPTAGGAFAQSAQVPLQTFCRIPDSMSYEQAAALPTAAGSAWLALFGVGKLQAGQSVLIHAAAGGVGSFAVQFAKRAGAYVMATASSQNHALVKELGADEVIDYRREDFIRRCNNVDFVIDTIGGDTGERSWQVIKPGGTLVSLADHTIKSRGDIRGEFVFFNNDAVALEQIVKVFESKQLQVILDTIHSLEEGRAALEQVAHGHARGKVIIRPSR
jgi:NADPH:quinone reductase-like Zn-dependent oxidoreductase